MEMIFYDGPSKDLKNIKKEWCKTHKDIVYILDGTLGYSKERRRLERFQSFVFVKNKVVLTNNVILLDFLKPNEERPFYDIYFYNKKKNSFVRLHDFYPNIRISNNVGKMYRAHMFTGDIERG